MRFTLIDRVLERDGERLVGLKQVSAAEEYLLDHFPGFPILPGVMMLEAMVQAARRLLAETDPACARHVLGTVKALKYGAMVKPGDAIRVEVTLLKRDETGCEFKGVARHIPAESLHGPPPAEGDAPPPRAPDTAVSGRFVLRPLRLRGGNGA